MDVAINEYIKLTQFLGQILGENYEVVLHWLDVKTNEYYIAAIENNHISGRNINSPITGFALELIHKKEYERHEFITSYKVFTQEQKEIEGSTFFIKDKSGYLKGLLCINYDGESYKNLAKQILKLGHLSTSLNTVQKLDVPSNNVETPIEVLSQNMDDIISSVIKPEFISDNVNLTQEFKLKLVSELDEKGVFQIKGSVLEVAKKLKVSEPSIYRYLKMIKDN